MAIAVRVHRIGGIGSVAAAVLSVFSVIAVIAAMVPFADADVNARAIDVEALGFCRSGPRQSERCRAGDEAEAEESFRECAHVFLQCCS